MFDPAFDPLQQLEQLQHDVAQIKFNIVELARAFNHQCEFTQQLTQQIAAQDAYIKLYKNQIASMDERLKELENNGW